MGDAGVDERADDLVRAGGVLDQEHEHVPVAQRDSLEAAERGAEALQARLDLRQLDPHRLGQRGGRERVVDVVEPGQAQADAGVALGRHEIEGGALEPGQLDVARDDVERRTRVAAVGAAVVAEMADVGRREDVRRAAADAVLRVGRVLQPRPRPARVVESEDDRPGHAAAARSPSWGSSPFTTTEAFGSSACTAARQRSATSSSSP